MQSSDFIPPSHPHSPTHPPKKKIKMGDEKNMYTELPSSTFWKFAIFFFFFFFFYANF